MARFSIAATGLARSVFAAVLGALLTAGGCSVSNSPEASGIQGLWEVTSVKNLSTGEVQPHRREYHLFGATHQMVVLAGANRPKLAKSLSDMTADEFLTQQPIGAGLYRYEAADGRITRTNVVALSAYYEGGTFPGEIELNGDTLVLRDSHSADGHEREWTMRRVVPAN